MISPASRRGLLAAGLALGAVPAAAQARPRMTIALNWIPNVQFAGLWIAMDRGYFAAEGIEARFTPGGPNAPDPLVALASGNAQLATSNWLPFLDAVGRGNDFVILGATYARSPGALCSMARRPIREPRDLVGARVLAQTPSDRLIMTRRRTIESSRGQVVGFLRALARGWRENEADPAVAARLAVGRYGSELGLNLAQQTRQNELQIPLVPNANGPRVIWFDPALLGGSMTEIARATNRTVPPAGQILDLSLIEEALRSG